MDETELRLEAEPGDDGSISGTVDEVELEPISEYVFPTSWAAARSDFTAAERRAAAAIAESRVRAEAIRMRGRQEARQILLRAEDRAQQILELSSAEADAAERRARLESEAILLEAQVRLDVFTQDFGDEPEEPIGGPISIAKSSPIIGETASEIEPLSGDYPVSHLTDDEEEEETGADPSGEVYPQFSPAQVETFASPGDTDDDAVFELSEADAEVVLPPTPVAPMHNDVDESEVLYVSPLSHDGDTATYRVTGPLTFARIMALERALSGLGGVSSSSVKPESAGLASISFVSEDPNDTIDGLLSVPGLAIRKAAS